MLTTAEEDGTLRSRPMATQEFDFDGDPGSTHGGAPKADEPQSTCQRQLRRPKANASIGYAQLVRDHIEELGICCTKPGFDEPDRHHESVVKARFTVCRVVRLVGFAKAVLHNRQPR